MKVFLTSLLGILFSLSFEPTYIQAADLSPTDDSYVDSADITGNHGWRNYMIAGEWDGSSPYRTCRMYLKFDLSSIPSGKQIESATLYIHCSQRYSPPVQVGAHYLGNDSWQEMNITWNNAPTGFSPTATDTVTLVDGFNSWSVTSDVQTAYAGDGIYSVVMRVPDEGTSAKGGWFETKEYSDSNERPYLHVEFVELPAVSLTLTPDTTTIPRGGTLGFQATVTNNTDEVQTIYFATDVTLPNGNTYPPFGYLFGPVKVTLNSYQSKSAHLTQYIPMGAPLGTYTYYGYVYLPGVGFVDEDQFDFTVTSTLGTEGAEDWETELDEDFAE
jgi:hypothetical protein